MNPDSLGLIDDRPSTNFSRALDNPTGLMMLETNTDGSPMLGTPRQDILDSRNGQANQVFGLGGRDHLIAGKRDTLYGGNGQDHLDAREGKSHNHLLRR